MTNRDKFDRYAAEAASEWEEEILHGEQLAAVGLPGTVTISAGSRVWLARPGPNGQAKWCVTPRGVGSVTSQEVASAGGSVAVAFVRADLREADRVAASANTVAATSALAKEGRLPLLAVMDEKLIPQNLSEYEKILLT